MFTAFSADRLAGNTPIEAARGIKIALKRIRLGYPTAILLDAPDDAITAFQAMNAPDRKPRGGKRPGAGRKPMSESKDGRDALRPGITR